MTAETLASAKGRTFNHPSVTLGGRQRWMEYLSYIHTRANVTTYDIGHNQR